MAMKNNHQMDLFNPQIHLSLDSHSKEEKNINHFDEGSILDLLDQMSYDTQLADQKNELSQVIILKNPIFETNKIFYSKSNKLTFEIIFYLSQIQFNQCLTHSILEISYGEKITEFDLFHDKHIKLKDKLLKFTDPKSLFIDLIFLKSLNQSDFQILDNILK